MHRLNTTFHRTRGLLQAFVFLVAVGTLLEAKQEEKDAFQIQVIPAEPALNVGDSLPLKIVVLDSTGQAVDVDYTLYSRHRAAVSVGEGDVITAHLPGFSELVVRAATKPRTKIRIPVMVSYPPLAEIDFTATREHLYEGTGAEVMVRVIDAMGLDREGLQVEFSVEGGQAFSVDDFGNLWGHSSGTARLVASVRDMVHSGSETLTQSREYTVLPNPLRSIELSADKLNVRTGDVVHFKAVGLDAEGKAHPDVPIQFTLVAQPDDDLGNAASAQIDQDGSFVAQAAGVYRIVASSGTATARISLRADARNVQRKFDLIGRGQVHDVHTSDLWVWEGIDGRDYCVTGTWGADGEAHFWDVTDPTDIVRIATIKVDARTVNDVKVSSDGRICVLSREGASNRKNGIVILDVTDPHEPEILSTFTDELTGGVHNIFIYEDHVYALSAGRRYDIINIVDPKTPQRVGSFELEGESHSIHDVWVVDGIAYSSNWSDGVVMVDVGNGVAGGSPSNPVEIGRYSYPSGWNHAAWPHKNEETGVEYVIAGDEAFPFGLNISDSPTYPRGWLHFIDVTDKANPKEVARFQVPEAGTHNLWVEDDVLYAAFYNGGIRAIDISGELKGDLYQQGREISWFLPTDKDGVIPNAPMVWGPQPHKGNVFFTDWNTGLWAVKLEPSVGQ